MCIYKIIKYMIYHIIYHIYFFFYENKKHTTIPNICLNHVIKCHVSRVLHKT